ncbi:uncharacterized protein A4U43_C10F15390 [Asparagus officinalis]|uniref:EF-hand domain-containing protein n=1 Tax=Asparagus officinalis TaxID=4686 RepID=A0A5P1E386_ASPOF|nr:uncharacterized protein A4U43_C10F15390 [Asparagus officinalis]
MVNDAVDSALDSEDMEEETEEEVEKVLAAIAGETASQLPDAARKERIKQPSTSQTTAAESEAIAEGVDDEGELDEIRARLAKVSKSMENGISEEDMQRIFKRSDINGDGKISSTELGETLRALGSTSADVVVVQSMTSSTPTTMDISIITRERRNTEIGFLGGYWIYKDPIDAFAPGICRGVVGAEGAERGRVFREGPLADGAGSVADAFARVHGHDGAEWERPLVFLVSGSGFGSEPGSAGLHFGFGGSRDGGQVKRGFC